MQKRTAWRTIRLCFIVMMIVVTAAPLTCVATESAAVVTEVEQSAEENTATVEEMEAFAQSDDDMATGSESAATEVEHPTDETVRTEEPEAFAQSDADASMESETVEPEVEGVANENTDMPSEMERPVQEKEVPVADEDIDLRDAYSDSYAAARLLAAVDERYTKKEKMELKNLMVVKHVLFDARYLRGNESVDAVMLDYELQNKALLYMTQAVVPVYELSETSAYYVAYADTMLSDGGTRALDAVFAHNNTNGERVAGCIADLARGLVYLPKAAYASREERGKEYLSYIQAEYLQAVYDQSQDAAREIEVMTETSTTAAVISRENARYDLSSTVQTAAYLPEEKMDVHVNGIALPEDYYHYDAGSGQLTIEVAPSAIASVGIEVEELNFLEKFGAKLGAAFGLLRVHASAAGDAMKSSGTLIVPEDFVAGSVLRGQSTMRIVGAPNGALNFNENSHAYIYGANDTQAATLVQEIYAGNVKLADLVEAKANVNASYNSAVSLNEGRFKLGNKTLTKADFSLKEKAFLALACSHITNPLGRVTEQISDWDVGGEGFVAGDVEVMIRCIERTERYVIIGVFTQQPASDSQTGYGVYKFIIEEARGGLSLTKKDKAQSGPQGDASFAGIRFAIINDTGKSVKNSAGETIPQGAVVEVITSNATGTAKTDTRALTAGKYRVRELRKDDQIVAHQIVPGESALANDAYRWGDGTKSVTVKAGSVTAIEQPFENEVVRGGVKIAKWSKETMQRKAQGGARLEGAKIKITNASSKAVVVDGETWAPGEGTEITLDAEGLFTSAADWLPYGRYQIKESEAPTGYRKSGVIERSFEVREDQSVVDLDTADGAILDEVQRGDLEFVKIADETGKRLANVAFLLKSQTTGEEHLLVTDENGQVSTASSWNLHSEKTNANDSAWIDSIVDDTLLDASAGIFFGGVSGEEGSVAPDDLVGALPYDNYLLKELACEANEGFAILPEIEVRVYRDATTVHLGTLTNDVPVVVHFGTTPAASPTPTPTATSTPTLRTGSPYGVTNQRSGSPYAVRNVRAVKTGDESRPLLYLSGVGMGAVLLWIFLGRCKRKSR